MHKIENKSLLLISAILLIFSIAYKFYLIPKYPLRHDEVYVLARANSETLNPSTKKYPFSLKTDVIAMKEFTQRFDKEYTLKTFLKSSLDFWNNFMDLSNHPPLNALLAKPFIALQNSILGIRVYSLCVFIFLLFCFNLFLKEFEWSYEKRIFTLAIFSSFSLVSYMAIFPKAYNIAISFLLLTLTQYIKAKKTNQTDNLVYCFLFSNLTILSHYFFGALAVLSLGIIEFFYAKKDWENLKPKYLYFWLVLLASYACYLPLYKYQVDHSNGTYEGSVGWTAYLLNFKGLISFFSLNYKPELDRVIYSIILVVVSLSHKKLFKNNLGIVVYIIIAITLFYPTIDLILDKKASGSIRFLMVLTPFIAMIIATSFYRRTILTFVFLIPALVINSWFIQYQKYSGILNSIGKYSRYCKTIDLNDFEDKTLFITKKMNGYELGFIYTLYRRLEKRRKLNLMNNIYFAYNWIDQEKLKSSIYELEIKRIISIKDSFEERMSFDFPNYQYVNVDKF